MPWPTRLLFLNPVLNCSNVLLISRARHSDNSLDVPNPAVFSRAAYVKATPHDARNRKRRSPDNDALTRSQRTDIPAIH